MDCINNIKVFQGIFLTKRFLYDGSLDQRFILNNSFIDTSTIKVYIGKENTRGIEYSLSENIFDVDKNSRIFFTNEVQDEKYEIRFGDGIIGKKLGEDGDGTYITVDYIVTDGRSGNGASNFSFSGTLESANNQVIDPGTVTITTNQLSTNGGDIEPLTLLSIMPQDCIRRSTGQLHQETMRQLLREYILILNQFLWLVENKWIHHNLEQFKLA